MKIGEWGEGKYVRDSLGQKVKRDEDRIKSLSSLYICHIYKYTHVQMYVLISISLKNVTNKLIFYLWQQFISDMIDIQFILL